MKEKKTALIPKIARKLAIKSVDSACILWMHQPKVPSSMMK